MVKSTRITRGIWSRCISAWRRLWAPLEGTPKGARRSRRGSQVDAEAEELKRLIRDSGFEPCERHARSVAIERLQSIIDKRGPQAVRFTAGELSDRAKMRLRLVGDGHQ